MALLAIANLRGLREAGTIFAVPTYAFVVMMYVLIGYGLFRIFFGGGVEYTAPPSALAAGRGVDRHLPVVVAPLLRAARR